MLFKAAILLFIYASTSACASDVTNADLQSFSSAELVKLERKLMDEVADHDRQLEEIQKETNVLREQKKKVDEEVERLQGAKEWELQEKKKKEEELQQAKADVERKQQNITHLTSQVTDLRSQIDTLEERLKDLSNEKDLTERVYHDPSLSDVLNSRAQNWGTVSRNVYNKTVNTVFPALSGLSESAREYRRRVSRTSRALEVVTSLLIYGFVIGTMLASYRVYTKVRGRLTIARLLFLGDAFCACFWTIMLLCFLILFDDPLYVMKQRSPTPFFVFQLIACFSYVNFVLLRVLVLASKMTLGALGETLAVVVVGHHYYVRVWQPAILDLPFRGTFFYYFCYAWLFSAFAYNRIQEFAPLKQLRGPKLPPLMWLRVLFARFTTSSVPDGDIENSAYDSEDDESHER